MKIKIFIIASFVFCSYIDVKAQKLEPINKDWIKEDSIFISKIAKAYKANPLNIEYLLSYKQNKRNNLGFGYYEVEGSNGKGYVSLFYYFIYYNNKLTGYVINAQMPNDSRLMKIYSNLYAHLFTFNKYGIPKPLYFGYDTMTEPTELKHKLLLKDKDIAFYMTPFSGTMYGDEGGWGKVLDNRACYIKIKNKITPEICELLLYSKNPATRLTAIEFYHQNPKLFKNYEENIEKRVNAIFNELPTVKTMSADEVTTENSKELVKKLVNQH